MDDIFDGLPSTLDSLDGFEPTSSEIAQSRQFGKLHLPSQHSGFRSETDSEMAESGGRFSPPAWFKGDRENLKHNHGSGFWNRNPNGKRSREDSRESSPEMDYMDADDGYDATLDAARRTRLPTGSLSPEKRRSPSPDPYPAGGDFGRTFGKVFKKEPSEDVVLPSTENPNCSSTQFHK